MYLSDTVYCAVRKNEDHEYADMTTISFSEKVAMEKSEKANSEIPQWAAANPVIRIAKVSLQEVPE